MTVALTTREQLIDALHLAAELEHNLMCQYLFAAYSMKRSTAEGLTEVQVERARGWESQVTLVARQEMEHLGLALNLLAAIGGTPTLTRPNFPQPVSYYGDLGILSTLTPFSPDTIRRFQEFEAPHPAAPANYCTGPGVSKEDARALLLAARPDTDYDAAPDGAIPYTSVQDLYQSLAAGFQYVAGAIGEQALFNGDFNSEIWGGQGSPYEATMDDLNQYGLDIIQVTDLDSALWAIHEIIEQGEGILAPPSYMQHVHYCIFTGVLDDIDFDAARPVVDNPMVALHPGVDVTQVNLLTAPDTVQVAEAFNVAYELMLLLMLHLYDGRIPKTEDESVALMNAIFFPLMTMFVRPLAEVLTTLPAFADREGNAGPGFEISDVVTAPAPGDVYDEFQGRFDDLAARLATLSIYDSRPPDDPAVVRLRYLSVAARRLADDWRSHWQNTGTVTS
jgi:hypothetical protein